VRRLFERYRQFQALPPDEVSRELRERRDEERAREVVFVPELDLSRTAWHEPPHPEAVNAATFALRRRMNAYPDPAATEVRELAAARHGVRPGQVAVGHGAAELLQDACAQLIERSGDEASGRGSGGELLVAWPGWRPLPDLAQRAGGRPVPVAGVDALAARVGADTRAVALSSPNDPTGAPVARADVRALCERVGEDVWVLLDEAFADFLEPGEDAAPLVAELPNLLVFRTFAKAHAMAGFRIGYVLAPTAELAQQLTPSFSVNTPAQAAAAWALELGDKVLDRRRAAARRERERLARALAGTSLSFAPSAAPFVWLSSDTHDGDAIAAHLRARRIAVAPGERWGDERHVRITLRDADATDRLIGALRELG
jgi:histidinol-phosphate aminotransferase